MLRFLFVDDMEILRSGKTSARDSDRPEKNTKHKEHKIKSQSTQRRKT